MKDTNLKTNRLSIAVLIFVSLLVIGFITMSKPEFEYKLTLEQSLEQILSLEDEMNPDELMEIIDSETKGYKVVDIRNPYEFVKGNIQGSKNIPYQNLFAKENIEFFDQMKKDSVTVVLCGYDQLEANGSWMLLQQLGYSNVKVLQGGYGYYSGETFDMFSESEIPQYFVEEPKYSFVEIMDKLTSGSIIEDEKVEYESIIPTRKKKETVIEGGC